MSYFFLIIFAVLTAGATPAIAQTSSNGGAQAPTKAIAPANPYTRPAATQMPTPAPYPVANAQPATPATPTVKTPVVANPVPTAATPPQKDPCAAYMGSYQTYAFCRDRIEKIKRMQLAKDKRNEAAKQTYERRQQRRNPPPKEATPPAAMPATAPTGEPTPGVATPVAATPPATTGAAAPPAK